MSVLSADESFTDGRMKKPQRTQLSRLKRGIRGKAVAAILAGMAASAAAAPRGAGQKSAAAVVGAAEAGESSAAGEAPRLSAEQIVQQMAIRNRERAEDLKGYTDERHYSVTYSGFALKLSASMVVDATYDSPSTKDFRIVSEGGSKLLVDKVLKKLLETEKDAAAEPGQTALTAANYGFTLVGQESVNGRPCYVLQVDPKTDSRLLYRGKVWVDAKDFAVAQIEAEPAQNPSFWIRRTRIHHVYGKTGAFWLPEHNQSETDVRVGGTAVLTIDYGTYRTETDPGDKTSLLSH